MSDARAHIFLPIKKIMSKILLYVSRVLREDTYVFDAITQGPTTTVPNLRTHDTWHIAVLENDSFQEIHLQILFNTEV